jgi:hypothetical protein
MLAAMGTERGDEFTLLRWDQAWSHYRHLEVLRAQYLGFFFTAVLAVTAFAGPQLASDSLRTSGDLLIVAALAFGLELLSGFLFLVVARLNDVLDFYLLQIQEISAWMSEDETSLDLEKFDQAPLAPRPWSDHEPIAEAVLKTGLYGFLVLSIAVLARSIDVTAPGPVIAGCGIAATMSCAVVRWVNLGRTPAAVPVPPAA